MYSIDKQVLKFRIQTPLKLMRYCNSVTCRLGGGGGSVLVGWC